MKKLGLWKRSPPNHSARLLLLSGQTDVVVASGQGFHRARHRGCATGGTGEVGVDGERGIVRVDERLGDNARGAEQLAVDYGGRQREQRIIGIEVEPDRAVRFRW